MRRAAAIASSLAGLSFGAAPAAAIPAPAPSVVTFDAVGPGTPLPFTAGGVRFEAFLFKGAGTCTGSVIPDTEQPGHQVLQTSCTGTGVPGIRATFAQPQSWA